MEITQQIILIVLSFCVWIVGGLAILMLIVYLFAEVLVHFLSRSEIMFFRFICHLALKASVLKDPYNIYYQKQRKYMDEWVEKKIRKIKVDIVIENKEMFSDKKLITLLESEILEKEKLATHIEKLNMEKIELQNKLRSLEDDED